MAEEGRCSIHSCSPTLSLFPEPFCDVKLQEGLVPNLRHVRITSHRRALPRPQLQRHHNFGQDCEASAAIKK